MPEARGEDRTGEDPAADSGYSEWISEVRRLYVEPKGPAELHFVADEDEDTPPPAKGRGRRLGRGRRSQQVTAAPEAAAIASAAPARPSLADLMAAGTATSASRTDVATGDGAPERETADPTAGADLDQAWPTGVSDDPEPAFEPWPVAVRDEPVKADEDPEDEVEVEAEVRPEAPSRHTPPVDEGWPQTSPRRDSEQAWIAALADAAEDATVPEVAPDPAVAADPEVASAPERTRSWWDEALLDDTEAVTDPVEPDVRVHPVAALPVTDDPAPRSSWFDDEPGAHLAHEAGTGRPAPLHDTVSEAGPDLDTGDITLGSAADDEPGAPDVLDPAAPRTRAEARAASRHAERTRRARRRRALVAAIVLLVVVAATWWVLRPHGAASAGATTEQHPSAAVVTQHGSPLAL